MSAKLTPNNHYDNLNLAKYFLWRNGSHGRNAFHQLRCKFVANVNDDGIIATYIRKPIIFAQSYQTCIEIDTLYEKDMIELAIFASTVKLS